MKLLLKGRWEGTMLGGINAAWCIHTFWRGSCRDCLAAMAVQHVLTGNTFMLTLPSLGRVILLQSEDVVLNPPGEPLWNDHVGYLRRGRIFHVAQGRSVYDVAKRFLRTGHDSR